MSLGTLTDEEAEIAKTAGFGKYPSEECDTCMMCNNQVECMQLSGKL